MDAFMTGQLQPGHRGLGQAPGGGDQRVGLAGQGEDGAMVMGSRCASRSQRGRGGGELSQDDIVAAFADVDDALEDHAGSTPGCP